VRNTAHFFIQLQAIKGKGMDISGNSASSVSAALEIKSAKLAKNLQEQEGQAALQLIKSADVPKSSSSPGLGSIINTYA
jgi:hypothetical protein